jgi:hypothetical protein
MLLIPTLLCPKPWADMSGNETQRFCTYCQKHVHNLEAMSASDRLALLSSPAASICSRYQVAIRRPAKGKEESYYRHLAKHGAGVALVGSAILVLWEMHGESEKERFYRAAAPRIICRDTSGCDMPKEHYCEHRLITLGISVPFPPPSAMTSVSQAGEPVPHVDVRLDPIAIAELIEKSRPTLQVDVSLLENKKPAESPALNKR